MPALADLQWAAENAKGWLKLSPRTCQLGMFLYNPQLLCTTMIHETVLSSGKTSLFIQNVTSPSPSPAPQPLWLWNNQVTQIYEAVWLLPLLAWLVSWDMRFLLLTLASTVKRIQICKECNVPLHCQKCLVV